MPVSTQDVQNLAGLYNMESTSQHDSQSGLYLMTKAAHVVDNMLRELLMLYLPCQDLETRFMAVPPETSNESVQNKDLKSQACLQ